MCNAEEQRSRNEYEEEMTRISLRYGKNLIAGIFITSGAFLLLEHLVTFKGFDLLDFAGHEYYGGALIFIGFLIGMKWHQWKTLNLKNIRNWIR